MMLHPRKFSFGLPAIQFTGEASQKFLVEYSLVAFDLHTVSCIAGVFTFPLTSKALRS
jgi:hypothetical protein